MDRSNLDVLSETSKDSSFYVQAKEYWSGIPPTVNGMLGGFGHISHSDIKGSQDFLQSILKVEGHPGTDRALDCGAGIGRVTKNLLINYFDKVDLVDQNETFIKKAKAFINSDKVGELYSSGLQDFIPTHKYDVIWCQWVLGHLTDGHFIEFMRNCRSGLKENGLIVVKENITSSEEVELDRTDSSVTRPVQRLEQLFVESGLKINKTTNQTNFPKGLYPVKMFALSPS